MSMKKIILYGDLKKFGDSFDLNVSTPREAVHALCMQIPNFKQRIKDGEFQIKRGNTMIDENELDYMSDVNEYHLIPVPNGSKRGGLLKIILGVVLIGIGWANMAAGAALHSISTNLMVMGAGMVLNGISQMVSTAPSIDSNEAPDKKQSYMFGGAVNITEEGNIIPVVYGKFWCGSLVASAGMEAVDF